MFEKKGLRYASDLLPWWPPPAALVERERWSDQKINQEKTKEEWRSVLRKVICLFMYKKSVASFVVVVVVVVVVLRVRLCTKSCDHMNRRRRRKLRANRIFWG